MPLMTDGERAADVDNPRGYYEWEAIKQIGKRPELLDDQAVNGRAIKCISMLLPRMPLQHNYKVIFYDPANPRGCRLTRADGEPAGDRKLPNLTPSNYSAV